MPAETATKEKTPCNLCGADDTELIYETVPLGGEGGKAFASTCDVLGEERLVRCRRCGLMYLNPRPRPSEILSGYEDTIDEAYVSQEAGRLATFAACWRAMRPYLPAAPGRVLDVGAAAGYFLKAAKDAGWEAHGVEPNKGLRDYARERFGVDMRHSTLPAAAFPDAHFDVVTLWDVLEHVTDPAADLREVHRVLKPGGLLVVNYPDISDVFARMAGKKWWFLLSAHLYYFTPKTIRAILEKTGFKTLAIRSHFQKLELGYLLERLKPYAPALGKAGSAAAGALGIRKLLIPYYASQRRVYARKDG